MSAAGLCIPTELDNTYSLLLYLLQKCWYFGIKQALIDPCFSKPTFTAAYATDRTYEQPNTYFGAPEIRRLNGLFQGLLTQRAEAPTCVPYHNSVVSLGFDFGQVFRNKDRSTGVMCIRCVCAVTTKLCEVS